jgi:hypothetical protein
MQHVMHNGDAFMDFVVDLPNQMLFKQLVTQTP